jgi:hypothetical protein
MGDIIVGFEVLAVVNTKLAVFVIIARDNEGSRDL